MKNLLKNKEFQTASIMAVFITAIVTVSHLFMWAIEEVTAKFLSNYTNYIIYGSWVFVFIFVFISTFIIKKELNKDPIFNQKKEERNSLNRHKNYSKRVAKLKKAKKCKDF